MPVSQPLWATLRFPPPGFIDYTLAQSKYDFRLSTLGGEATCMGAQSQRALTSQKKDM